MYARAYTQTEGRKTPKKTPRKDGETDTDTSKDAHTPYLTQRKAWRVSAIPIPDVISYRRIPAKLRLSHFVPPIDRPVRTIAEPDACTECAAETQESHADLLQGKRSTCHSEETEL